MVLARRPLEAESHDGAPFLLGGGLTTPWTGQARRSLHHRNIIGVLEMSTDADASILRRHSPHRVASRISHVRRGLAFTS